jgi:hypothetical protein
VEKYNWPRRSLKNNWKMYVEAVADGYENIVDPELSDMSCSFS